jgi:hypothetical protein
MAGRVRGLNKSQLIREYLREYPGVRTRDVVTHFKAQGVEMSPQLVASIRCREFGSYSCGDVRLSEVKSVRDFVQKSELDVSVAVQILSEFASLVDSFGGVGRFRRVLSEYVRFEDGEKGVDPSLDPEPEHEDHEEDVGTGSSYIDVNEDED